MSDHTNIITSLLLLAQNIESKKTQEAKESRVKNKTLFGKEDLSLKSMKNAINRDTTIMGK